MSRWSFIVSAAKRAVILEWVRRAPDGFTVEIREPKRSNEQNALMWVHLTTLSRSLKWHGLMLSPEDWKDLLSAGLKREVRTVPNVTGDGFVMLGMRTSEMTKAEMTEFLEFILAFAAQHGVDLDHPESAAA